jgi:hypothetical protein
MRLFAHHAGEDSLVNLLLLLGSGAVPLLVAMARGRLASAYARLTRKPTRTSASRHGGSVSP